MNAEVLIDQYVLELQWENLSHPRALERYKLLDYSNLHVEFWKFEIFAGHPLQHNFARFGRLAAKTMAAHTPICWFLISFSIQSLHRRQFFSLDNLFIVEVRILSKFSRSQVCKWVVIFRSAFAWTTPVTAPFLVQKIFWSLVSLFSANSTPFTCNFVGRRKRKVDGVTHYAMSVEFAISQ